MSNLYSIIYGIHPIQELLRAKKRTVQKIYTTNPPPKAFTALTSLLPKHVPVLFCERNKLTTLAQTDDHQGVVATVTPFATRKKCFTPKDHPYILMLDGVQDPRNVGAIIRSAFCANVDGIVIPQKNTAPLTGTVCKASAGLIEHSIIYQPPSSNAAIQEIKSAGYHIYLATIDGVDVRTVSFSEPSCIVIGSEGTGITAALRSQGTAVTIPQKTASISYNASVATGILLFIMSSFLKRL